MKQLNEQELWDRINELKGKTILTIRQSIPNIMKDVTDHEVILINSNGRISKTSPSRADIINVYFYLVCNRQVTTGDYVKIPGSRSYRNRISIISAILRDAVPEQIEAFKKSAREQHYGIRLNTTIKRQKDWDKLLRSLIL